jgi:hypothetical protein
MHINPSLECQSCATKLLQCDIRMVSFVKKIQDAFPDCHVAIGFRDQADQHQAKVAALSTFDWPDSPHNSTINNLPCSRACDLFSLEPDGKALFLVDYFKMIWSWYEDNIAEFGGIKYNWGGNYAHLKDFDHFELGQP